MYTPRFLKMHLQLLFWWALAWDVVMGSSTSSTYSYSLDDSSYYSVDYYSVDFPDCSGPFNYIGDGDCDTYNNNEVR